MALIQRNVGWVVLTVVFSVSAQGAEVVAETVEGVAGVTGVAGVAPKVNDARLKLELFAQEPDIVTPTGIEVDGAGRVYVMENLTHFRPADYDGPVKDRIRLFEDTDGDGTADKVSSFYEGLTFSTDLAFGRDGWLYVATRGSIVRMRDNNDDGKADRVESIIRLETTGDYPHNGISGLAFDQNGVLFFGFGENLGHAYKMIGTDGVTFSGEAEGGSVYRVEADGTNLKRIATGFWNPFGMCFDEAGNLFAVDNDPGGSPPCRLLHIVEGGDYGYEYRYGRTGQHQFVTWNAELPGTLPRMAGTGEAPCEVMAYRGNQLPAEYRNQLLVGSWGNNALEYYRIEPKGASFTSQRQVLIQGDENFRPVGIATGPDGAIYFTDWVDRDYSLHGKGRIWKLTTNPDPDPGVENQKPDITPEQIDGKTNAQLRELAQQLRQDQSETSVDKAIRYLAHSDPFIRNAAMTGLTKNAHKLSVETLTSESDAAKRLGLLIAFKRSGEKRFVEALPVFLADADEDVRFSAIKWISDDKLTVYRPLLEKMFDDPKLTARLLSASLAATDRIDGRKAVDFANESVLFKKIRDDKAPAEVRAMCLQLVRADHPNLTVQLLERLVDVGNASLTLEVLRAAPGRDRPDRGQFLADFAQDSTQAAELRAMAVTGLGWFAAEHQTLLVELAVEEESMVRDEALSALVGAPLGEAARSRIAGIATNDPQTKQAVARLLGKPRQARPAKTDTEGWAALVGAESSGAEANADAGRRVFASATVGMCSLCHVAENRGRRVGPNLTSLAGMDRKRVLQSILEPAREIAPEYIPHALTTADGQTRLGLFLTTGGGNGKQGYLGLDGIPFSVFTDQLVNHQVLSISLMPEGLAQNMTLRELRDLIAYLERLK